jgi:hypothetical protein
VVVGVVVVGVVVVTGVAVIVRACRISWDPTFE